MKHSWRPKCENNRVVSNLTVIPLISIEVSYNDLADRGVEGHVSAGKLRYSCPWRTGLLFWSTMRSMLWPFSTLCYHEGRWLTTAECDGVGNFTGNYCINFTELTTVNMLFLKCVYGPLERHPSFGIRGEKRGMERLGNTAWICSACCLTVEMKRINSWT